MFPERYGIAAVLAVTVLRKAWHASQYVFEVITLLMRYASFFIVRKRHSIQTSCLNKDSDYYFLDRTVSKMGRTRTVY